MLSQTAEYALRAMTLLAQNAEGSPQLAKDLSEASGIPTPYLSKILGSLTTAGILKATRGRGGGYTLKEAPNQVTLYQIVSLFDGPEVKPACVLNRERPCVDDEPCSAHETWKSVRKSYVDFLESTTLDNISAEPTA